MELMKVVSLDDQILNECKLGNTSFEKECFRKKTFFLNEVFPYVIATTSITLFHHHQTADLIVTEMKKKQMLVN